MATVAGLACLLDVDSRLVRAAIRGIMEGGGSRQASVAATYALLRIVASLRGPCGVVANCHVLGVDESGRRVWRRRVVLAFRQHSLRENVDERKDQRTQ